MNGFAGLALISLIPISFFFFFWKIRGFLFSVNWAFFILVGLPIRFFFFFQKFFWAFFSFFFLLESRTNKFYFLFEGVINFD